MAVYTTGKGSLTISGKTFEEFSDCTIELKTDNKERQTSKSIVETFCKECLDWFEANSHFHVKMTLKKGPVL